MMTSMNPQTGGPVGGGMMIMNNVGVGTPSSNNSQDVMKTTLNTYIYEYFLRLGHHELARSLHKNDKFEMNTSSIKQSPGRRKDGDMNGDAMDMDGNDDIPIPDDLPRPSLPGPDSPGNGFLFDWFCLFHDMFQAQRQRGNPQDPSIPRQYINQTQNLQRQRENLQNAKLPGNGMMPGNQAQMVQMRNQMNMQNRILNGDMSRQAMAKSMTPQQISQMKQVQHQQLQQQMQRDGSDMGINGQRPSPPADGDNGGSPSKRPRLEGQQQFNGGMMPNGRGQGMPVNQSMLMQSGFNPAAMNQAPFRQNGALQQKAMQGGPMANGINMMGNTGSPMMGTIDPQFNVNGMGMDGMNYARMPGQAGMPGGPAAQTGNHALQDYQMQLMLLEQQNKKRLMMARQEQDNITRGDGGAPLPGQVGMQPPGMSPSGSRTGTSPNPMDPMKRGASQMGGTGSPAGDPQGRGSPIHFMQGIAPDFNNNLFMNTKDGLVPGGPGMRPQNMDMNALRAQQGRINGQFPPGQPMVQNPSQGQPQPMGTPGQRNEMPPPSAPATGGSAQRGAQPSSPNSGGAPPTPSGTNKPNPKGKKGKEGDNARKRPNKKNSTTTTNTEDPPATPTPSTPITPVHPASFNTSGGKGPGAANANPAPTSNPTSQPVQQMNPTTDPSMNFDTFGAGDQAFNLDFSTLENPDVLENFDFDSFLNQSGEGDFGGDFSLGGDTGFGLDGVTDG